MVDRSNLLSFFSAVGLMNSTKFHKLNDDGIV